ncbi:MAG: RHS repeat-associated core domain-containing protein, partial [Bacteroidota bacterium]|nr:RHS repeat-associated core domain-containing protein [Bacteroidota bacterium]
NHLGNVLTVITDKCILSCIGDTVSAKTADIVSATDYSPFGAPLAGRTWQAREYRFGFNGQEKDDEVSGVGNTMTAEFWEYDGRLGRRWNVDPKPISSSISPYATFNNNPILFIDRGGDTTFIYNRLGQYVFTILDSKSTNEIVFLTNNQATRLHKYTGAFWSEDKKADLARNPNFAYARITEQTISSLNEIGMSNGFRERGGLLIINGKTKIVGVYRCMECESEIAPKGIVKGTINLNNLNLKNVNVSGKILGGWHDHNLSNTYAHTQPTDEDDTGRKNVDFNGLTSIKPYGGVGLINNLSSITIYPLSFQSIENNAAPPKSHFFPNVNSVMNQNPGESKRMQESEDRYGVFNKKGLGVKP